MNLIYTKTALYAYANLQEVMAQIDDLVERKALLSMSDFSPCIEQCEKIVDLIWQKDTLIELKAFCDRVLSKLTPYDLDCLDYKYFKKKPKEYYVDFDAESRNYFRKQTRLVNLIAKSFDKMGLTDDWFENNALKVNFMIELLRRVKIHEEKSKQNKVLKVDFKRVA